MALKENKNLTLKRVMTFWVPVIALFITAATFIIGSIIGNLAMILISGGISVVVTCLGFAVAFSNVANILRR